MSTIKKNKKKFWLLLNSNYKSEEEISKIDCSKIVRAIYKLTKEKYSIRIFKKNRTEGRGKNSFLRNIQIIKSINHINVIKVFDFFEDEKFYDTIMEYCEKSELFDFIVEKGILM